MGNGLDETKSWAIAEHHERHFYITTDGVHRLEGKTCRCSPRTSRQTDGTWHIIHQSFADKESHDGRAES